MDAGPPYVKRRTKRKDSPKRSLSGMKAYKEKRKVGNYDVSLRVETTTLVYYPNLWGTAEEPKASSKGGTKGFL